MSQRIKYLTSLYGALSRVPLRERIDELFDAIPPDEEFARISRLPVKRALRTTHLHALLRQPDSDAVLWPVQLRALAELEAYNNLVANIPVGQGKTLIIILAASLFPHLRRPLILVPTPSVEKISRDIEAARKQWRVRTDLTVMSYERLSSPRYRAVLSKLASEILICDEGHKTGTTKSARRARIENAGIKVKCYLSGSMVNGTSPITSTAPRLESVLGAGSPLPLAENVFSLRMMARAFEDVWDPKSSRYTDKIGAGAYNSARSLGRRMRQTPGVLMTYADPVDVPLIFEHARLPPAAVPTSNDVDEEDASEDETATTRQLIRASIGIERVLEAPYPVEWLLRRTAYRALIAQVINAGVADSPSTATKYIKHEPAYKEWLEIKSTFTPTWTERVLSDAAARHAAEWMDRTGGLCWVWSPFFGRLIEKVSGAPFYHELGCDASGNSIIDHPRERPAVASMTTCSHDLNLQYTFTDNLFTTTPSTGDIYEQAIARTHRHGQTRPVNVTFVTRCSESVRALNRAIDREKTVSEILGYPFRKLLIGGWR